MLVAVMVVHVRSVDHALVIRNNYGLIQDRCFDPSSDPSLTDFSNLFEDKRSFNAPIGGWGVSKVINVSFVFRRASAFNQPAAGQMGCIQRDEHA